MFLSLSQQEKEKNQIRYWPQFARQGPTGACWATGSTGRTPMDKGRVGCWLHPSSTGEEAVPEL